MNGANAERSVSLGIPDLDDAAEVGRGGFGTVYRAREPGLGRLVAVKVLRDPLRDPDSQRRFDRECQAMGQLSHHPNIVTVFRYGQTAEGSPYLLMEYVERGALAVELRSRGNFSWQETLRIAVKICGALESAHNAGILHRDVKPENILKSRFGEPMLTDFGIAKIAGVTGTRSSQLVASFGHVAPELLSGAAATPASDVYSLGSTLFTLLAGHPPFTRDTDDTPYAAMARMMNEPIPDLRPHDIPDQVCSFLERAMDKNVQLRFPSALAMGTESQRLQRLLDVPVTELVIESSERGGTLHATRVAEEMAISQPGTVVDRYVSEARPQKIDTLATVRPTGQINWRGALALLLAVTLLIAFALFLVRQSTSSPRTPAAGAGAVPTTTPAVIQPVNVVILAQASASQNGGGQPTGLVLKSSDTVSVETTGITLFGPDNLAVAPCPRRLETDADGRWSGAIPSCQFRYDVAAADPQAPIGALIGRIDTGPWFFVGSKRIFVADRAGQLWLAHNDSYNGDNQGAYSVTISIDRR